VDTQFLSLCLEIMGIAGTLLLIALAGLIAWYYRGGGMYTFRWHWRSIRMKQLLAVASLFFLAMAASYGLLQEVWGFIYLIAAFKVGTWWFRIAISQRP
jgi:hypothetical protein